MPASTPSRIVAAVQEGARPLRAGDDDYDALLDHCSEKRFVLMGEASHGTRFARASHSA